MGTLLFLALLIFTGVIIAGTLIYSDLSAEIEDGIAKLDAARDRETFETMATFAELHRDIVAQFGRFPHRNKLLGRENTSEEDEYLAGDSPDFGQGG